MSPRCIATRSPTRPLPRLSRPESRIRHLGYTVPGRGCSGVWTGQSGSVLALLPSRRLWPVPLLVLRVVGVRLPLVRAEALAAVVF